MSENQEFEIVNPSDCVYMTGAHDVVCVATLMLGRGKYGLVVDGESKMPLFFFGGNVEGWFKENFDAEPSEIADRKGADIIAALRTLRYESERSSMNDIGRHATEIADSLEEQGKEKGGT